MATITGFTATRMLAFETSIDARVDTVEAEVVVSGAVDGSGHLILTTGDSSTIDAGSIMPASFEVLVRDLLYPVGCIYTSTVATNPGSIFGGTWAAFGSGRIPIGVNSGDARIDASEKTGGTDTLLDDHLPDHRHLLAGNTDDAGAHGHGLGTLTTGSNSAAHTHSAGGLTWTFTSTGAAGGGTSNNGGLSVAQGTTGSRFDHPVAVVSGTTGNQLTNHNHTVAGTIASAADHNHALPDYTGGKDNTVGEKLLPPFISVYMWKRTA